VHKSLGLAASYPDPNTSNLDILRIEEVLPEVDGILYGYDYDKLKGRDEFANTITKTPNLMAKVGNEKVKLTIPQLLKLAGYPQNWKYTGSYDQVWGRIGNSIMPPLSYAIADNMNLKYFNIK